MNRDATVRERDESENRRIVDVQAKEIQSVYRAQPFQPFVIHLADGRAVCVDHPELMAPSLTGRSVVVYGKGGQFESIDVLRITSLKVVNGKDSSQRKK